MSWELMNTTKYQLPDGSIFVIESWMDDWNRSEERIRWEKNNNNWSVKTIHVQSPDLVNSYDTYEFYNSKEKVKISECNIKKQA